MSKKLVFRDAKSGRYVLGRDSFARISEVEGIRLPRSTSGRFKNTAGERSPKHSQTSAPYSKKK